MAKERNLSEQDYFAEHGVALGFREPFERQGKAYDFNMKVAQLQLQTSATMNELIKCLNSLAEKYAGERPNLLYFPGKPSDLSVLVKPYSSVLTKVYRINYLRNGQFPSAPKSGFVQYITLYDHDKMNDLLRGRLVCKYMDGPQLVAKGLKDFCNSHDLEFLDYPMNNEMGYYAWHCYIRVPIEIMAGEVETKNMWFELQITTQLAELITGLTHGLYEGHRVSASRTTDDEWRWQPKSQRFRSAYLGHSLHLLEGIILTFRDEVLGLESPKEGDNRPNGPSDSSKDGAVELTISDSACDRSIELTDAYQNSNKVTS
jgi:hypothetical protein